MQGTVQVTPKWWKQSQGCDRNHLLLRDQQCAARAKKDGKRAKTLKNILTKTPDRVRFKICMTSIAEFSKPQWGEVLRALDPPSLRDGPSRARALCRLRPTDLGKPSVRDMHACTHVHVAHVVHA